MVASEFEHRLQVWLNSGTVQVEPLATPPAIEGDGIGLNPWIIGLFSGAALLTLVAFARRPRGAGGVRRPRKEP